VDSGRIGAAVVAFDLSYGGEDGPVHFAGAFGGVSIDGEQIGWNVGKGGGAWLGSLGGGTAYGEKQDYRADGKGSLGSGYLVGGDYLRC